MKVLITTVAGTASRFNRSLRCPCLKCLYYEGDPQKNLLGRLLEMAKSIDEIIVVGGYRIEDLAAFIKSRGQKNIHLIYNDHFADFGSGFSLLKGLEAALERRADEIIFAEGDLFFGKSDFYRLVACEKDVLTVSRDPVVSEKSVALYWDADKRPHYVYNASHGLLEIPEPFLAICNSAQVWKFLDPDRLRRVLSMLTPQQERGSNLEMIQPYFGAADPAKIEVMQFSPWVNCNTVEDYRRAFQQNGEEESK